MDALENRTTNLCRKVHELPPVLSEWQQTTWRPECEHYDRGVCGNPACAEGKGTCPFDGKSLPLREATENSSDDLSRGLQGITDHCGPEVRPPPDALREAILRRVGDRTGGRVRALDVAGRNGAVVIRGRVPCHHVKQLVLQGVLDVVRAANDADLKIDFQVEVCAAPAAHS
jgi:hypothetical protein